jgi:class 3 adenylate cyclase
VKYARSGGLSIVYEVTGAGERDIVFFPDAFIPVEDMDEEPHFRHFLARLETFGRLIRFDPRGIGSSDPIVPVRAPSLEEWMDDVVAVQDAVGSRRAALVALAEGGFIAALMAATLPQRVHSLTLINATPGVLFEPVRPFGVRATNLAPFLEESGEVMAAMADMTESVPIADFAPSAIGDERYKTWLGRAWTRAVSPSTIASISETMYASNIHAILPAISVPTLVIHRSGNRWFGPEHGRYLAEHIAGARYVELPGDDHVPYLGDADSILDEIEAFITGTRSAREADRVLATVLFTDIVGSTEIATRLGDARWTELLDRHDAIVREQIERHVGRFIDSAGDGVVSTFDGPARAVRCACAIRDELRPLDIEIRAGVHTGEIERRGDDIRGIAVHIGQRVSSLAGPGEVLVSRTVTDLVAGSGLQFESRGASELKGVSGTWDVYAVVD